MNSNDFESQISSKRSSPLRAGVGGEGVTECVHGNRLMAVSDRAKIVRKNCLISIFTKMHISEFSDANVTY